MLQWGIVLGVLVALGAFVYAKRQALLRWHERTGVFLKEVRVEMQKVVWPSRQEVYGATFVVMVSVVILTIAIGIEDSVLSKVLDLILSLASS